MGPARCAAMDSYRVLECTVLLSLLVRFLICMALFANKDERWRGLIGTDSQSLLIDALSDDDDDDHETENNLLFWTYLSRNGTC